MQTMNRLFTLGRGTALAAACLFVIVGCAETDSPGPDHAGHVNPAHKPKSFPEAVQRLRELNDGLVRDLDGPPAATSFEPKTLQIALDIANWLPEIAADSDMPVVPWNRVNSQAAAIVSDYQAMIAAKGSRDTRELVNSGKAISELESVLAAADPRWFDESEKQKAEP